MNRTPILLVALLALLVAACSTQQAAPTDAQPTATVEATPEATPEETAEPTDEGTDAPDGGTALEDLIPDELNGVARTDVPGMEAFIGPMLEQQGVDGDAVEYVLATYGEGADAMTITAVRIPGMSEASLEALARAMAGAQGGAGTPGSAEAVTVGGKSVLRMTADEADGAAYLYFADGAVFTVVGESEDLAEQLLSELP